MTQASLPRATIMAHLQVGASNANVLHATADLAARLSAGVIGIAACQPMRLAYGDTYISGDVLEQDRAEIDDEIAATEAEFRAALIGRVDSLEWRSTTTFGALHEYLAREARAADLLVAGLDRKASLLDPSRHVSLGDLVMQAGRPVLIVPPTAEKAAFDRVLVAWKDTRETRRAALDALPLLKAAGDVAVVQIAPDAEHEAAQSEVGDVAAWLRRHGVPARPLAIRSRGDDAARLKEIARDERCDLLVAGAYGHSRMREWVLGGVTRELLLRADRCTLVSH